MRRDAIVLMKLQMPSSGCESRPTKGEPAQSVASLATVPVTRSAKRRYASVWAVVSAAKRSGLPSAEAAGLPSSPPAATD